VPTKERVGKRWTKILTLSKISFLPAYLKALLKEVKNTQSKGIYKWAIITDETLPKSHEKEF